MVTNQARKFVVWNDSFFVPDELKGAVVAIGNFDGVHLGHQLLIQKARELADLKKVSACVVTFEPHPQQFFNPDNPFFRLSPEMVKLSILSQFHLDGVFIKEFTKDFSQITASQFMDWLFSELKVSGLIVGYDFHFGAKRHGTPLLLEEECDKRGIIFSKISPVSVEGKVVSSSLIRQALSNGTLEEANKLLGYRWFIRSKVEHGDKRGRTIGFPTANMRIVPEQTLKYGVYAVRVRVYGQIVDGVASFGKRPTFDGTVPKLEVFLFDFEGNLYGQSLDVEFAAFLREEFKFQSVNELVEAMNNDCNKAKEALRTNLIRSLI